MRRIAIPPQILLSLASLFWAGNAVVGKAVADGIPPMTLSFWRWTLAFFLLLPFSFRSLALAAPTIRRHWKLLLLYAVLGTAGCNILSYSALHFTTAINSSLINSASPIYVMVFTFLLFGDRIRPAQGLGVALSTLGVLAILSGGSLETLRGFALNIGDLMMVVAIGLWSAYTALLRKRPDGIPPLAFATVLLGLASVILLPLHLVERAMLGPVALTWENLLALAYVAIFPAVLSLVCWNRGVIEMGANRASPYVHLLPVFGCLLAVAFLGERFGWHHAVGIGLILCGVWLASRRDPSRA